MDAPSSLASAMPVSATSTATDSKYPIAAARSLAKNGRGGGNSSSSLTKDNGGGGGGGDNKRTPVPPAHPPSSSSSSQLLRRNNSTHKATKGKDDDLATENSNNGSSSLLPNLTRSSSQAKAAAAAERREAAAAVAASAAAARKASAQAAAANKVAISAAPSSSSSSGDNKAKINSPSSPTVGLRRSQQLRSMDDLDARGERERDRDGGEQLPPIDGNKSSNRGGGLGDRRPKRLLMQPRGPGQGEGASTGWHFFLFRVFLMFFFQG